MSARIQRYIVKGPCSNEWLELCKELPEATLCGSPSVDGKRIEAPKLLAIVRTKKELARVPIPEKSKIIIIFQKGSGSYLCSERDCKVCNPSCERWKEMSVISRQELYQT